MRQDYTRLFPVSSKYAESAESASDHMQQPVDREGEDDEDDSDDVDHGGPGTHGAVHRCRMWRTAGVAARPWHRDEGR